MRQMQGEEHRRYRRILTSGLQELDIAGAGTACSQFADRELAAFSTGNSGSGPRSWAGAVSRIATAMLAHLVFGGQTSTFDRMVELYSELGPNGVVWTVGARQADIFRRMREQVRAAQGDHSLASLVERQGNLDETMLGNLIYMVELGRYDLAGLFRWISRFATEFPDHLTEVENGDAAALAYVREVLRLEQAERLMRDVKKSFVWRGMLIPKGSLLRVCIWEAHKDPAKFPDPFAFDPGRFRDAAESSRVLFPFGLDHHRCPFAELTERLATIFLKALSRYEVMGAGSGSPVRGPYHWEPGPNFSVTLKPRNPFPWINPTTT
jgi:cytochrome P450